MKNLLTIAFILFSFNVLSQFSNANIEVKIDTINKQIKVYSKINQKYYITILNQNYRITYSHLYKNRVYCFKYVNPITEVIIYKKHKRNLVLIERNIVIK